MKELGITKGEWSIDTADAIKIKAEDGSNIAILTHLTNFKRRDTDEVERNAMLIADAGNTAQKCGLLPSELLQQRDELREALILAEGLIDMASDQEWAKIRAAIKNTKDETDTIQRKRNVF